MTTLPVRSCRMISLNLQNHVTHKWRPLQPNSLRVYRVKQLVVGGLRRKQAIEKEDFRINRDRVRPVQHTTSCGCVFYFFRYSYHKLMKYPSSVSCTALSDCGVDFRNDWQLRSQQFSCNNPAKQTACLKTRIERRQAFGVELALARRCSRSHLFDFGVLRVNL